MALIIDTETTGLCSNVDHIVQISLLLCNEQFEELDFKTFIVDVGDFIITNAKIHGITNEISKLGVPFSEVVPILHNFLEHVSHIMAHNASFDFNMIEAELKRLNKQDTLDRLRSKELYCTMKQYTQLADIRRADGTCKFPSLIELYKVITGVSIAPTHNSEYGVKTLFTIIKQLYKTGKFIFPSKPIVYTKIPALHELSVIEADETIEATEIVEIDEIIEATEIVETDETI